MNPYYPGVPAPAAPAPVADPVRRMEQLRDALRGEDTLLSDLRSQLDNHARSRRYDDCAKVAAKVKETGERAHKEQRELDELQTRAKR